MKLWNLFVDVLPFLLLGIGVFAWVAYTSEKEYKEESKSKTKFYD